MYTRQVVALDGTSANSSNRTSNAFLLNDAIWMSASYMTAAAVASVVSVQMSSDDGLSTGATAPNFSTFTSITAAGGFGTLTLPGVAGAGIPRWIRFVRSAADSQASVVFAYKATY